MMRWLRTLNATPLRTCTTLTMSGQPCSVCFLPYTGNGSWTLDVDPDCMLPGSSNMEHRSLAWISVVRWLNEPGCALEIEEHSTNMTSRNHFFLLLMPLLISLWPL